MEEKQIKALADAMSFLASVSKIHKYQPVTDEGIVEYECSKWGYENSRMEITERLAEAGIPKELWCHFDDLCGCIHPF